MAQNGEAVDAKVGSGLIDLTQYSLADLDRFGETVLGNLLRRLLAGDGGNAIAAFDASIRPPSQSGSTLPKEGSEPRSEGSEGFVTSPRSPVVAG